MTNQLDQLVELGAAVIANEETRKAEAAAEKTATLHAELKRVETTVIAALGLDTDTFAALAPKISNSNFRTEPIDYVIDLTYSNQIGKVRCYKPRYTVAGRRNDDDDLVVEFPGDEYKAPTPRESLAKFLLRARQKYADILAATLADLAVIKDEPYLPSYRRREATIVWSDPQVIEARLDYLVRNAPERSDNNARFEHWLPFANVLNGYAVLRPVLQRVGSDWKWKTRRNNLLEAITRRRNPETDEPLAVEQYDEYAGFYKQALTLDEIEIYERAAAAAGLTEDAAIAEKLAEYRALWAKDAEDRLQGLRRADLQAAAFRPFYLYEIRYGILAQEDGEREVSWESFKSLHEHGSDGWYRKLNDTRIRPTYVCAVIRHEITSVEQMRESGAYQSRETDAGQISVPPDGAELMVTDDTNGAFLQRLMELS